jgi:RES domain-containing protein
VADRISLEDILSSLKGGPWSGRIYRVMLGDFPPDRENVLGARWNPPEVAAIYACLEPEICIAEVDYNLARQPRPVKNTLKKTLYEIELELGAMADLGKVLAALAEIGIGRDALFANDMKISQEIGRLVTWFGLDGLLVPSARGPGDSFVIYPGRAGQAYRFEVVGKKLL